MGILCEPALVCCAGCLDGTCCCAVMDIDVKKGRAAAMNTNLRMEGGNCILESFVHSFAH